MKLNHTKLINPKGRKINYLLVKSVQQKHVATEAEITKQSHKGTTSENPKTKIRQINNQSVKSDKQNPKKIP